LVVFYAWTRVTVRTYMSSAGRISPPPIRTTLSKHPPPMPPPRKGIRKMVIYRLAGTLGQLVNACFILSACPPLCIILYNIIRARTTLVRPRSTICVFKCILILILLESRLVWASGETSGYDATQRRLYNDPAGQRDRTEDPRCGRGVRCYFIFFLKARAAHVAIKTFLKRVLHVHRSPSLHPSVRAKV